MTDELLRQPSYLKPHDALRISQQAPRFFKSQQSGLFALPYPLSLLTTAETQDKWQTYENLLYSCLRTGDDQSAYLCVEELQDRFGAENERVQALKGLHQEATAKDDKALEAVLRGYDEMLSEKPNNFPIRKRRAALLRSMGRTANAIAALTALLDDSPIDAEAWAELADLYLTQGLYSQAIFCLEEVLLIMPNAWNMHARLAEVTVLSATATDNAGDQLRILSEAMRRFCRSIELCDNYIRGYYGLKLTTSRLLEKLNKAGKSLPASTDPAVGDIAPPSVASVQKLNELATSKLAEIVRKSSAGEKGWDGYDEGEVIAARELLDRDTQKIQR